jgi:hypothetical protein
MAYAIVGAVIAFLVPVWWLTRRPLSPTQLEPMSRSWLLQKTHHPLDTP